MRTYTRRELLRRVLRGAVAAPVAYIGTIEAAHRAWSSRNPVIVWIADLVDRVLPH
jgi:hypothetical protein